MSGQSVPAGVEWQYSQETQWGTAWGGFEYGAAATLEAAFKAGQYRIMLASAPYEIDLEQMVQTNLMSGFRRGIRRFTMTTLVPPGEAWEYLASDGSWVPYDVATCEHLRIARAAGCEDSIVRLETPNGLAPALFDFTQSTVQHFTAAGGNDGAERSIRVNAGRTLPPNDTALMQLNGYAGYAAAGSNGSAAATATSAAHHAQEAALAQNCTAQAAEDECCAVCLEGFSEASGQQALRLRLCGPGHYLHHDCILRVFAATGPKCPTCSVMYGLLEGTQPPGTMTVSTNTRQKCAGYTCATLVIRYSFPSGVQGPKHPNPGQAYHGTNRVAYLPDNAEGRSVLALLKRSFDQKLTFTVGTSITTGISNCVVWNGVHHKTSLSGGSARFGYPDDTYILRVKQELSAKGIV